MKKARITILHLIAAMGVLLAASIAFPGGAKKTKLQLVQPSKTKSSTPSYTDKKRFLEADSVEIEELRPDISFSGFDKPYNSKKETFLITNNSNCYIGALKVRIEYYDMQERMIHVREEQIYTPLPAEETRMITLKAFDPQSTLYYYLSRPPRNSGQPFTVKIRLLSLYFPK